jgi:small-conductance mechanosensitive channel/CRP-like cAMP-binding protein
MLSWTFGLATAVLLILYNFSLALPNVFGPEATKLILFFLILCASVLAARWISLLVASASAHGRKNISGLVFLLVGVLVFIPALAANLHFVLQLDLAALLTTSAIFTALIGFALQSTLGNLFEGLAMHLHRPFRLGDVVIYDGMYGEIEDLSWRALRIRQEDGASLIVPNSALAKGSIKVLSHADSLRILAAFAAPADVEPRKVLRTMERAIAGMEGILASPAPQYLITNFNHTDTTVQYTAEVWIRGTQKDRAAVRSRVYEKLWYGLARENIPFGFLLFDAPHRLSLTSNQSKDTARQIAGVVLRDASADALATILANSRVLMFGPGERLRLSSASGPFAAILVSGLVNAPISRGLAASEEFPRHGMWSADLLDSVTDHFRDAIGPAAPHIVATLAPHTSDAHELYQRLADQVPDEYAKSEFLSRGPYERTMMIRSGGTLGFAAALLGDPLPEALVCRTESVVLQIDAADLKAALRNNPDDVSVMATIVRSELAAAGNPRSLAEIEEQIRRFVIA